MAPEERNGTPEQTVIGRATTVVAGVGAQARVTAADARRVARAGHTVTEETGHDHKKRIGPFVYDERRHPG